MAMTWSGSATVPGQRLRVQRRAIQAQTGRPARAALS